MKLRCQPGDLAVVLKGDCTGMFVTVLARGPDHPIEGWPSWDCSVSAECYVAISTRRGRITGHRMVPPGTTVYFLDNILQPIRPRKAPLTLPAPLAEEEVL